MHKLLVTAEKMLHMLIYQRVSPTNKMRFQNIDYGTGTIKEVRITPCPEAAQRRPCVLKKGTNVTIEVDFQPSK